MKKGICKRMFAGLTSALLLCTSVSIPTVTAEDSSSSSEVLYTTGFEDGVNDFTRRGTVETLEISTAQAKSGTSSLCVSTRAKSWQGPQFKLDDYIQTNTEYTVSASAYTQWYSTITLSIQYRASGATSDTYSNVTSVVSNGSWMDFEDVKISFPDGATDMYVYFECSDPSVDLYLDDFTLATAAAIPIQEDIASLSDVYGQYFKMGTAITTSNLSSPSFMDLVEKHFGQSITPGNELKPDSILDQAASIESGDNVNPQVDFSQAAAILNYCAENNIPVRGHVLVWHSQTPDWFFKEGFQDDGDWVDKDTMIQRMENYIKNVMEGLAEQFPDVNFYAWDVVNEAWQDSGIPRVAGSSKSEDSNSSAWTRIFGDNSFIEYAFQFARKYAPEGCKLYYNDYNEYVDSKTTAIYNMAMELKEKGLIDGIGMQSHLDVSYPTISMYKKALDKFASTGLDIQVTELDITTSDTTETGLKTQAQMYSDLFDLYVEYADSISAVVLWGVTDDQSWRASRVPLLFDEEFQAKPAYYSIVDGMDVPVTTTTTPAETTTAAAETTTDVTATTSTPAYSWDLPTTLYVTDCEDFCDVTLTGVDLPAPGDTLEWTSSDPSILEVMNGDEQGAKLRISPATGGTVTISVSLNGTVLLSQEVEVLVCALTTAPQTTTTPDETTTETTTEASATTDISGETTETTPEATVTTDVSDTDSTTATTDVSGTTTTETTTEATGNTSSAEATLYGDINLDGRVDLSDAVLLSKANADVVSLGDVARANGDCNADGTTDGNDAIVLLKFLVHIIDEIPYKD